MRNAPFRVITSPCLWCMHSSSGNHVTLWLQIAPTQMDWTFFWRSFSSKKKLPSSCTGSLSPSLVKSASGWPLNSSSWKLSKIHPAPLPLQSDLSTIWITPFGFLSHIQSILPILSNLAHTPAFLLSFPPIPLPTPMILPSPLGLLLPLFLFLTFSLWLKGLILDT